MSTAIALLLNGGSPPIWFLLVWVLCIGFAIAVWIVVLARARQTGPLRRYEGRVSLSDVPSAWRSNAAIRYPFGSWGALTVAGPLARVSYDDTGIAVQPVVSVLTLVIPGWAFPWTDIVDISMRGSQLRFRLLDVSRPIMLTLYSDPTALVETLKLRGLLSLEA